MLDTLLKNTEIFLSESMIGIAVSIIILVIGLFLIKWVIRIEKKALDSTKMDKTLKPFIISLTNISLKILLAITIYQIMGGKTASFVTLLGATSLTIGLAFQGSLSNFAGGVLILTLRPFHVGDFIEVNGHTGNVEAINVFNTVLITLDNKVISIPNGQLSNAAIVNYTVKPRRRVDLTFGVGYESDTKLVAKILEDVANNHPLVIKEPSPFIRLAEHGDSSLNFVVRLWCNTGDYWTVHFDMIDQVKDAFDQHNISIPFPQMDVHVNQVNG